MRISDWSSDVCSSDLPQDKLVELVHSLKAPYRQGACWVMNSDTLARIRKFKTTDGAFVWQPGLVEGQAATLLGYPVVEAEDMPDAIGRASCRERVCQYV